MYSNIMLVVLFIAVVVVGVFLAGKSPSIPDGYVDNGFCARDMPGNLECNRFYNYLAPQSFFGQLSKEEKVDKINEYIAKYNYLMAKEPTTFPTRLPADQMRVIELALGAGDSTSGERSRSLARLSNICPTEAVYDVNGKIRLEPNGLTFSDMNEYLAFITSFYANNECKPIPAVKPYGGTPFGIVGGAGTGTANAGQVASERNDRTVVDQALSDLYDRWDSNTLGTREPGTIPVRTFQFPAPGEQTYAKTPVNSLDDYEYNRVFELENRPRMDQLSKDVKNNLLGAMQLDWPTLPYSSDTRTQLEEQFVDARMQDVTETGGFREPMSGVFFKNMEGVDVEPPDEDAASNREANILSAYQPTEITTHVVDDEYERVAKVVAQQYSTDPDWEPVVEKRGDHQYAVTELRPRRKKDAKGETETVWEGEAPTTVSDATQQGLMEGAPIKPTSMSIQDNLADPFFAKTGVADHSNDRFWRYDSFNKWTPGLERMFAPTDPTNEWH